KHSGKPLGPVTIEPGDMFEQRHNGHTAAKGNTFEKLKNCPSTIVMMIYVNDQWQPRKAALQAEEAAQTGGAPAADCDKLDVDDESNRYYQTNDADFSGEKEQGSDAARMAQEKEIEQHRLRDLWKVFEPM